MHELFALDRFILDMRVPLFLEFGLLCCTLWMASLIPLLSMIRRPCEVMRCSGDDVRDFHYKLVAPSCEVSGTLLVALLGSGGISIGGACKKVVQSNPNCASLLTLYPIYSKIHSILLKRSRKWSSSWVTSYSLQISANSSCQDHTLLSLNVVLASSGVKPENPGEKL